VTAPYAQGDRVRLVRNHAIVGTVVHNDDGLLAVDWDADADGGPYEDDEIESDWVELLPETEGNPTK